MFRDRQISSSLATVDCYTCGTYEITHTLENTIEHGPRSEKRWALSGVARRANQAGSVARFGTDNVDEMIASVNPPRGAPDAIDRVLLHVVNNMTSLSRGVVFKEWDWPLFMLKGKSDLHFVIQCLKDVGLATSNQPLEVLPTPAGWNRAEQARRTTPRSRQAFVAMWFNATLSAAYNEGIKPALEDQGYEPLRIDLVQHNEKIDDRIIAEIRRSAILVADFTGQRGGVYFEAGFALGLGIPVIFCCQEVELANTHFDTRQYHYVAWKDVSDLKQKLSDRIGATAPGPTSKTPRI